MAYLRKRLEQEVEQYQTAEVAGRNTHEEEMSPLLRSVSKMGL